MMTVLMSISLMKAIFHTYNLEKKQGAIDKRFSIAISRRNRHCQTFVNSEYALKSLLANVCQYICNNDYGVNIGQVTSSRLCRICTNLRILSGIFGVSRNKQNEGKISILGSQKSKKVTKILLSHH